GRARRGCYFGREPRANSHNAARRPCPGRRRRRRSRPEPIRYRAKALDRAEHGVRLAGLPTWWTYLRPALVSFNDRMDSSTRPAQQWWCRLHEGGDVVNGTIIAVDLA